MCPEHTTPSGIALGFHPRVADAGQPLALQPLIRHPGLRRLRLRQVPIALRTHGREDRLLLPDAQRQQVVNLGARLAPLFPVAHAHAAAQPRFQLGDRAVVLGDAEVRHPASHVLAELVEPVAHGDAPTAPGQFPDAMLEVLEGLLGPTQRRASEGKPEEHAVVDLCYPALALVDHQFQAPRDIASNARHDALPGAGSPDKDQQIIRVADKPVASPFQFAVQVAFAPRASSPAALLWPRLTSARSRRTLPCVALPEPARAPTACRADLPE